MVIHSKMRVQCMAQINDRMPKKNLRNFNGDLGTHAMETLC